MPSPDDNHDHSHPSAEDDHAKKKRDLWAAAKLIAETRRGSVEPAAPPPPPPPKKKRIKLRVPPGARAAEVPSEPEVVEEAPQAYFEEEETQSVESYEEPAAVVEDEPIIEPEPEERKTRIVAAPKSKDKPELVKETEAPKEKEPEKAKPKSEEKPEPKEPSKPDLKTDKDGEELIEPLTEEQLLAAAAKARREKLLKLWITIGGRSLSISVGIHLLLLIIATLLYVSYTREEHIDFLSGGTTQQGQDASQALENKVTRKKNQWLNKQTPMQKVAVKNAMSQIQLPDQDPILDLPMNKDFLPSGKAMGASGFGEGIGLGAKGGLSFKPITLFGKEIIGKKLAVILDVSYSMTPFLQEVVKEVDRVAHGSPVVLYYGCGLQNAAPGTKVNERAYRTQERGFDKYWRYLREDPTKPPGQMPNMDVYQSFNRRNNTFYVDHNGTECTWTALLNDVLRNADALYWFSDFEDPVDAKHLSIVKENLELRKQRLYIHPQKKGFAFEQVRDTLAIPTGGDVIEPKEKK